MATLVVALDTPDLPQALALADKLAGSPVWCKVGLELFSVAGPDLIARLKDKGFSVFLDLKLFDIPNTVQAASRAIGALGVDMLTIHTMGGERMARAALAGIFTDTGPGAKPSPAPTPLVMGVTVLTSTAQGEVPGYTGDIGALAIDLAKGAADWGLHGVVCSGFEVQAIKAARPQILCLTPGIRLAEGSASGAAPASADDQRRIMTPAQAVEAGSDFLVVGRPITRAADPLQSALRILQEMETASCQRRVS